MEELKIQIPLFHVDTQKNNENFIMGGTLPPSLEDGDWAGRGIYFWDNLGNAQYWLKEKNRKNQKQKYNIVRTYLSVPANEVLDLTEPTEIRSFEESISTMQRMKLLDKKIGTKHKGAIINAYWKVLNSFGNATLFSVVKVIGYYPKINNSIYFKENDTQKNIQPYVTIKGKVIYAIRDLQVLSDNYRKIIEVKEERL